MSRQVQLNKIVGRCIAKKREAAGMSQEEVADKLHMSTEGYARYERGETPASLMKLSKLATLYGCGLDELVVETSTGLTAQAQHIANLLDGVSSSDRDEIVKIVESICALSHKKHKKSLKPY
ncbi:helix-turn-helix domain-containing protein [Delftia lacustris]|nr:MAG: transcriptional regulator [Azospira oryzae]